MDHVHILSRTHVTTTGRCISRQEDPSLVKNSRSEEDPQNSAQKAKNSARKPKNGFPGAKNSAQKPKNGFPGADGPGT